MAKYLSVDFRTGKLYEFSSTKQEGFVEYKSSTGSISYRRYENRGVLGELLNVGIRNSKFGDVIQVAQKTQDGTIVISRLDLYDKQYNVDQDFAEPFIRLVGSLKKGETYKFLTYSLSAEDQKKFDTENGKTPQEKYYDRKGVSIKLEDGTKVDNYLYYRGDDESIVIPEVVWKEHPSTPGKKRPSAASLEVKTEFLVAKLKEAIENGLAYEAYTGDSNQSNDAPAQEAAPKQESAPVEEPQTASAGADEEYDDLPF